MTYYVFWLSRPCSYCPITKKNWVGRSTWFYKQIELLEIYHIIYSVICNCWNHSPMIEAWQFFITAKSTSPLSPPTMKVSGASERCSLKKYHTGKKFLLAMQLIFLSGDHLHHWRSSLTTRNTESKDFLLLSNQHLFENDHALMSPQWTFDNLTCSGFCCSKVVLSPFVKCGIEELPVAWDNMMNLIINAL